MSRVPNDDACALAALLREIHKSETGARYNVLPQNVDIAALPHSHGPTQRRYERASCRHTNLE